MTKRIYVATQFKNYERARAMIDDLKRAGYEITHDWTRTDEFDLDGKLLMHPGKTEKELSPDLIKMYAEDDLRGVRTADLVVLLADNAKLAGAFIECGAALAYGIPIYTTTPDRWTIFFGMDDVTVFQNEADLRTALGACNPKLDSNTTCVRGTEGCVMRHGVRA